MGSFLHLRRICKIALYMPKKSVESVVGRCRDCIHCVEVLSPSNLLSIEGNPTLGRCSHWCGSRSFVLSQMGCEYWKQKV